MHTFYCRQDVMPNIPASHTQPFHLTQLISVGHLELLPVLVTQNSTAGCRVLTRLQSLLQTIMLITA